MRGVSQPGGAEAGGSGHEEHGGCSGTSCCDLCRLLHGEEMKGPQPASAWEIRLRIFGAQVSVQKVMIQCLRQWGRATTSPNKLWFPEAFDPHWAELLQWLPN